MLCCVGYSFVMWRVFRKKVNQTVDWSDEMIRERSPVQLHDFVVYNSIFFEDPALIVKKRANCFKMKNWLTQLSIHFFLIVTLKL